MRDTWTFTAIAVLGIVSYAMRVSGFLAAKFIREESALAKFLHLAPGNLFVAFVSVSCLGGGWSCTVGCASALLVMALTRKEWLALATGLIAAGVLAAFGR